MEMWHWPQYTMLVIMLLNVIANAIKTGIEKKPNLVICSSIGAAIEIWILHEGGFW